MAGWTVDAPQRLSLDEPVSRLDVRLFSGRLNVVATDGPARVDITRVGRRPILVEQHEGRLSVRQERHWHWRDVLRWIGPFGHWSRVDVSIAVPADVRAELRLVDGSLVVSGLRRHTRADVTSGQITLMGLRGNTMAKIVSGPVEALGVGGDLHLETVSGEVILADSAAAQVRAQTVSGAITCDLDNPRSSEIRLHTISGSITVRVREDSDLAVRLHTTSGRITSGFPQVMRESKLGSVANSEGVLGAGDGKLWASATSGSIALLARPVDDDEEDELP
ncbi:hypothetical protein D7147_18695 [Micromonospora musae]|uniref:DUF4097 domain-containing protein n=2 Tax=Micromonospora musae TaxID=1894970 RepID=A0A3A9Y8I3_9ACTN|nr:MULTISPECIES: DUF4097 family beta strand repeat-containing protein [Micromonospora]RKN17981.1 hypothetical protein D7147_18695 [Micromonospora musae]RKN32963.1 hypothetical protein D7044_12135 [Micromonospora musae]TYC05696.1 DUF4097 domain-containing protein [Micromonospora sp. WP24]